MEDLSQCAGSALCQVLGPGSILPDAAQFAG
jgi:hypothetical protein